MKNKFTALAIFFFAASFAFAAPLPSSAAVFNPNFVISDEELTDYTSMTLSSIARFLRNKAGILKAYIDPESKKTAAEIIFESAWKERINPKYLLVTLQKEQSLVEDPTPTKDQLDWATGWGVCDSCSKRDPRLQKYKGFKTQVEYAAGGTRFYLDNPHKFSRKTGGTYKIDGKPVTFLNDATRALYLYTPHLQGVRNFWKIWQRWFGKVYPDGTLLQAKGDPGVWLIQYGIKRPFQSKAALLTRYDPKNIITVEKSVLDQYPTGTPIKFPNYSLIRSPKGTVCLIVDDTKRCITSREAMRKIGFNPEEIIDVGWGEYNDFIDGEPITEAEAYVTGALLQDSTTGGVFWVINGVKRPIVDRTILKARFKNYPITPASPEELSQYPQGEYILFPDGSLITAPGNSSVYVIERGKARPIVSAEVFESFGYQWDNVIRTSVRAVEIHPRGKPLDLGASL